MKHRLILFILLVSLGLLGCADAGEDIVANDGTSSGQDSADDGDPTSGGTDGKPSNGQKPDKPSDPPVDTPNPPKECNPDCNADEKCVEGECLPICLEGTYCDGECLDLAELHLSDCNTCAEDYCDSNNNLVDGCDIYVKGDDNNNCGSCGNVCKEGTQCSEGNCASVCEEGETFCNGSCLRLDDLHLSSCSSCATDYCDTDGNLANGCEVNSKGSDVNNCGACGNTCNDGEACESGSCKVPYESHRMIVVGLGGDTLMVRTGPGTENNDIGELNEYQYITVLEEKNGWYRHNYNGQDGWSSGDFLMDACDKCEGRKAIDYAEKFLYDYSTKLCTWDHLTHEPIIENFTDLWANYSYYNHGYNDNCANFVTACLKSVGLISSNYINVGQIDSHCNNNSGGWRKVGFSQAKAGDIWVNPSRGHTELVVGYKNNTVYLIGSNNFNSSNYGGCQINTGASAGEYQRVSYGAASESSTGFICSRQ